MLHIGDLIGGRYLIEEIIGQGGMSIVYKALCTIIKRKVAIKVLRPEFSNDEEFVNRFKVEAQAAGSLSHHNIVNIYDVGYDEGLHYIVMEYVEGCTLKEHIMQKGPFSPEKTLNYAIQICEALVHAHEHHIIHCDIKPHNILVTKNDVLKVADFGIARAVTAATICVTDYVIGSVHYSSPEQARGSITDEKSDIYSLGIVMYEMITGKTPFTGDSPVAIALKHIEEPISSPSNVIDTVPRGIENIIIKATQKKPEDRYLSAREMLAALKNTRLDPDFSLKQNNVNNSSENTVLYSQKELEKISNTNNSIEKNNIQIESNREDQDKEKKDIKFIVGAFLAAILLTAAIFIGMYKYVSPSGSQGSIQVPNLENMTLSEANEKMSRYKVKVSIKRSIFNNNVEKDHIISQEPQPGQTISSEQEIFVTMSKGEEVIEVPSVLNLPLEEAERQLYDLGLKFEVEEQFSDLYPENTVIEQTPEGRSVVEKSTTVKLVVSKGEENKTVIVPSIVGKTLSDAKKTLDALYLGLTVIKTESSLEYPKDTIVSQSINAGEQAKQNDVIQVVISSGSEGILFPNVVGKKLKDAKQSIVDLGLTYEIKYEYSKDYPKDIVIDQNVAAKSPIDKNQIVVLTVSLGKKPEVTKIIKFTVPEDRIPTHVKIVVLVDGEEKVLIDKEHTDSENREIKASVTGSDITHVTIYLDDELFAQQDI